MRTAESGAQMRDEVAEIHVARSEHVKLLQASYSLRLDLTVVVRLHDSARRLVTKIYIIP